MHAHLHVVASPSTHVCLGGEPVSPLLLLSGSTVSCMVSPLSWALFIAVAAHTQERCDQISESARECERIRIRLFKHEQTFSIDHTRCPQYPILLFRFISHKGKDAIDRSREEGVGRVFLTTKHGFHYIKGTMLDEANLTNFVA